MLIIFYLLYSKDEKINIICIYSGWVGPKNQKSAYVIYGRSLIYLPDMVFISSKDQKDHSNSFMHILVIFFFLLSELSALNTMLSRLQDQNTKLSIIFYQ